MKYPLHCHNHILEAENLPKKTLWMHSNSASEDAPIRNRCHQKHLFVSVSHQLTARSFAITLHLEYDVKLAFRP